MTVMRRKGVSRIFVTVAAVSVAAVVATGQHVDRETEPGNFFDFSAWNNDEKDELLNHALALRELGKDIDWTRGMNDNGAETDQATDTQGRRRLLSEEEFLRSAENDWDADFRKANDGQDRDVVAAGGSTGGVLRKAKKVPMMRKKTKKVSMRMFEQRQGTYRCIDDSPSNKVKCPPQDLGSACDKYNDEGSFLKCFDYCKPSFCCIHDSLSTTYSPSCAKTEPNCPSWFACYIIWWKLHDTVGPANYLRIEQDEPFYDAEFDDILFKLEEDTDFFQQLFGHHFDTDDPPTDKTFEDPDNW